MLVTGIRANGPALAIATDAFAGRADVRAGVVAFALCSVTVTSLMAFVRRASAARPAGVLRTGPDGAVAERASRPSPTPERAAGAYARCGIPSPRTTT